MTTTCDKCGGEIRIGDYPFCKGIAANHVPSQTGVIGDDIPGGVEIKHGEGICNPDGSAKRYYSKSAIAQAAKAAGYTPYVRHVGAPGSDKSKFTQRWV